MTPPNWDHVDHELTRKVLAGETLDEFDITEALEFAAQCLKGDANHPDVTHEVYYARAIALADAEECFLLLGDAPGFLEALKKFWSV